MIRAQKQTAFHIGPNHWVFAALDPDDEVYERNEDERAEIRVIIAAAAPHLMAGAS